MLNCNSEFVIAIYFLIQNMLEFEYLEALFYWLSSNAIEVIFMA
jgi:hypothetical protein